MELNIGLSNVMLTRICLHIILNAHIDFLEMYDTK